MEYFESESQPSKGTIESSSPNQLTSPSYMSIYGMLGTAPAAICPLSGTVRRVSSLLATSPQPRIPQSTQSILAPLSIAGALWLKCGGQSKID